MRGGDSKTGEGSRKTLVAALGADRRAKQDQGRAVRSDRRQESRLRRGDVGGAGKGGMAKSSGRARSASPTSSTSADAPSTGMATGQPKLDAGQYFMAFFYYYLHNRLNRQLVKKHH
jgi:hypothetical protein